MGDLLYSTKRKTRTSDEILEDAILTDNCEDVRALEVTSTMEYINKQLKLILSKLEGLEIQTRNSNWNN